MSLKRPNWPLDSRGPKPRQGRHNRSPQRELWEIGLAGPFYRLQGLCIRAEGANTKALKRRSGVLANQNPQLALGATVMPPLAGLEHARR